MWIWGSIFRGFCARRMGVNAGGFLAGVAVVGFGDCTINRHGFANKRRNIANVWRQDQCVIRSGQFIECLHILFGYKEWGSVFTVLLGQPMMGGIFFFCYNQINTTTENSIKWHLRIGNDTQSFCTCLGDGQQGRCFTICMVDLLHALSLCGERKFLFFCMQIIIPHWYERTWCKDAGLPFSLGHVYVGLSNTFGF